MNKVVLNAVGMPCPGPVVKAMKALRAMTEPGILEVHVDNTMAVENLKRMASGHHCETTVEQRSEQEFVVLIDVKEPVADASAAEEPAPEETAASGSHVVVAIGSERMGEGDDVLGAALMKSFLFALTQLPELPECVIFYNGGVKLTAAGAPALENIQVLEENGVKILTCGTCLNHHGLPVPPVGEVSNMYDIAERLMAAGKVIRP